jgi:hypothetical protein
MNRSKLSVVGWTTLGAFVVAALMISTSQSYGRTDSKEKNIVRERTAGPLVEEADKNIKVLNGMPESQLIPAMKFMSVSLGVGCNYCHVSKDGQLNAAADDKEKKRTARTMIKMVVQANKTTFHGDTQISCYTCHRGQPIPQNAPNLPVALRTPSPAGAALMPAPSATPAWPSADEILNKYVDAIGGQAAVDKIESAVIRGTVVNASGSSGTFESDQVAPDKGYEIVTTQRGTWVRVLKREQGWEKNVLGTNALTTEQLANLKLSLPMFGILQLKRQFSTFDVVAKDKIESHDVYVVKAIRPDQKQEDLYFDSDTGLLVREVMGTNTKIGVIPEETDFDDYRIVEGIKLPTTVRFAGVDSQNPSSTRKIDTVTLNAPVDDGRFNKPD